METNYFLFNINQHLSAIKAEYVAEVFALPELILIPDSPLNIVGLLNLRGEVLPILDFQVGGESDAASNRGDRPQPYRLTDSIIVLSQAQLKIGLVVNSVQGMRALSSQEITPEATDLQAGISPALAKIVSGTIADEDANEGPILIFNEPNAWFSGGEIQQFISVTSFLINDSRNDPNGRLLQFEKQSSNLLSNPGGLASEDSFCPTATPEERIRFRQRADNLKRSLDEDQPLEGTKTLVVITLNDQLFGIDSQNVREFITIRQATPIPCCP
ncbi:MAG: chemotaxis protein CheW, partial [Cyanobacteria bacterium J06635_15]